MTTTPPTHPTHNIHLSTYQIHQIISSVYPNAKLLSITQSDQSFNNRIYFLSILTNTPSSQPTAKVTATAETTAAQPLDLVLKVNGRFFDGHKVENEVGCLLLLHRCCPRIPVPRVIAWSTDGVTVQTVHDSSGQKTEFDARDEVWSCQPWVLMTRLLGRRMTEADAVGVHGEELARRLAGLYSAMRAGVPGVSLMGNLALFRFLGTMDSDQDIELSMTVAGGVLVARPAYFLNHDIQPSGSITTIAEFYTYLFADELHKLHTCAVFASIRDRLTPIFEAFVSETLPHLSFLAIDQDQQQQQAIKFTHHDFSPRNILLLDPSDDTDTTAPSISGLIDFEFSGFFPATQEILNAQLQQDWPGRFLEVFAGNLDLDLELNSQTTRPVWQQSGSDLSSPPKSQSSEHVVYDVSEVLRQGVLLTQLIDHIAHWRFHALDTADLTAEQYRELNEHAEIVEELIARLTEPIKH